MSPRLSSSLGSLYVSGKLPTYPSPKPTLTLSSHLGQNVVLGEGLVGSFPETYKLHILMHSEWNLTLATKLLANCKNTASRQTNDSQALNQTLQTKNINFDHCQANKLQSVSIFFKFFHPCLLFFLLCYLYFLSTFWTVFLKFRSVWWQFLQFSFYWLRDTAPLRDGPLEKLWGGWGIFDPQEFFFRYQIPCMNFFYAIAWIFFRVNWRAWIFFYLMFPCGNIFFCTPPPPITFLMVRP